MISGLWGFLGIHSNGIGFLNSDLVRFHRYLCLSEQQAIFCSSKSHSSSLITSHLPLPRRLWRSRFHCFIWKPPWRLFWRLTRLLIDVLHRARVLELRTWDYVYGPSLPTPPRPHDPPLRLPPTTAPESRTLCLLSDLTLAPSSASPCPAFDSEIRQPLGDTTDRQKLTSAPSPGTRE
jgi:hypothetical protein